MAVLLLLHFKKKKQVPDWDKHIMQTNPAAFFSTPACEEAACLPLGPVHQVCVGV